jgi:hypothetical protein
VFVRQLVALTAAHFLASNPLHSVYEAQIASYISIRHADRPVLRVFALGLAIASKAYHAQGCTGTLIAALIGIFENAATKQLLLKNLQRGSRCKPNTSLLNRTASKSISRKRAPDLWFFCATDFLSPVFLEAPDQGALRGGYRVIAPDMRGYGQTDRPNAKGRPDVVFHAAPIPAVTHCSPSGDCARRSEIDIQQ